MRRGPLITEAQGLGNNVIITLWIIGLVNASPAAVERQSLTAKVELRLWRFWGACLDVILVFRPPGTEDVAGHDCM